MIKASEARAVAREAREASAKQMTLAQSRELEKNFQRLMAGTDVSVKSAMSLGEMNLKLRFDKSQLPDELKKRYEDELRNAGYGVVIHTDDTNQGWEIMLTWECQ